MNADIPTDLHRSAAPDEIAPGLLLQVAARKAQTLDAEMCRVAPIKPPYMGVLFTIGRYPGIRQGTCAEMLGYDATTFGRYIERMVRQNLVERSVPSEDRRAVCLKLTTSGEVAQQQCTPILSDLEADVRQRMGEEEWNQLNKLLVRFLDAFDHPLPSRTQGEKLSDD